MKSVAYISIAVRVVAVACFYGGTASAAWNSATGVKTDNDSAIESSTSWTGPQLNSGGGLLTFSGNATTAGDVVLVEQNGSGDPVVVVSGQLNQMGGALTVSGGAQLIVGGNYSKTGPGLALVETSNSKLQVLGNYVQTGGILRVIYESATLDVDGSLTFSGDDFVVTEGGRIDVGIAGASSISSGYFGLGNGAQLTIGTLMAHGNTDVIGGSTLKVLNSYVQDGGKFNVNYNGAKFSADGTFNYVGSEFVVVGLESMSIGNAPSSSITANRFVATEGAEFSVGSATTHGDTFVTGGAKLNVLGNFAQDAGVFNVNYNGAKFSTGGKLNYVGSEFVAAGVGSMTIGNAAGSSITANRFVATEGAEFSVGSATTHGDTFVTGGAKLNVLGNYSQDAGLFNVIYDGAKFSAGGTFNYVGQEFVAVGPGSMTVGNAAGSAIAANRIVVAEGASFSVGSLTAHGDVEIKTQTSGLHVLGNFIQDAGNLSVIYNSPTLTVDGSLNFTGSSFVAVDGGRINIGNPAASSINASRIVVADGARFSVGSVTSHGDVEIKTQTSSLHVLGNYVQDAGSLSVIYNSPILTVDGSLNFTGEAFIAVDGGRINIGNPGASAINANRIAIGGGAQIALQSVTAHGLVEVQTQDTTVHVLGNYVQDADQLRIAYENARLNIDGSLLFSGDELRVYSDAQLNVGGAITIADGSLLVGDSVVSSPVVLVRNGGRLGERLTVNGNVINQGVLGPGKVNDILDIGLVTIQGTYAQSAAGSAEIEVGGLSPGYGTDKVVVSGIAQLAGRLDVPVVHGFQPHAGDTLTVFEATSLIGDFETIASPNIASAAPGLSLETFRTGNQIQVRFVAVTSGNGFQGAAATSNWSDSVNWSLGAAPAAGAVVVMANNSANSREVRLGDTTSQRSFVHDVTLGGGANPLTLKIANQGALSAIRALSIANNGTLEIAGGAVTSGALNVGAGGRLNVSGGGRFTDRSQASDGAIIDSMTLAAPSATATISGAGSWFVNSGPLLVGDAGRGDFVVDGGATADSGMVKIASQVGSVGSARVDGTGSTWRIRGDLSIGGTSTASGGAGELRVLNHGVVAIDGRLKLWKSGDVLDLSDNTGRVQVGSSTGPALAGVSISQDGALSGAGTIKGNVASSGLVAPGNSPGILTINGNYTQSSTSVLEIEVGGTSPGPGPIGNPNAGHDQVRVGGAVTLGGRYNFPIINGFHPAVGQVITFIDTFDPDGAGPLLKGSIVPGTAPIEAFAPGLEAANPNLAFRVISDTALDQVRLQFINKSEIFLDTTASSVPWFQETRWTDPAAPTVDRNPGTADNTMVTNVSSAPQRVTLNANNPLTSQPLAEVRRLEVADESFPVTLEIDAGFQLNATVGDAMIGSRGAIELAGGKLQVTSSQAVKVVNGGMLAGQGQVIGSVSVGETGTAGSTLSPGAGATTGKLDIVGDYTQGPSGVYMVDIASNAAAATFDSVTISDMANLDGVVKVDVSRFPNVVGQTYKIMSAAGILGEFDDVQVVGNDNVYFSLSYGPSSVTAANALEGVAAIELPPNYVTLTGYPMGDANRNGAVDRDDARVFAAALVDKNLQYFSFPGKGLVRNNYQACFDFYTDGQTSMAGGVESFIRVIDYDDVDEFASRLAAAQSMSVQAAYSLIQSDYQDALSARIPEPPAAFLLVWGFIAASSAGGRRRRFHRCRRSINRA